MSLFNKYNKPLFLAEISSNHNNDLNRCKELISASKEAGCDGVKFQLFKINQLFSKEALIYKPEINDRVKWELSEEIIPELSAFAKKNNLLFSCTPFYLEAVNVLNPFVDFFKIASYELLWKDLFYECGKTGKPLVFSTGMANNHEIKELLSSLKEIKSNEIMIMHCNSSYPTPISDVNLSVISTLKKEFEDFYDDKLVHFGYSDHTVNKYVLLNSIIKYNSKMIEFHIDLDGRGFEFNSGHCWLPNQIKDVIDTIDLITNCEGNPKITNSKSEEVEREWRADPSDGLRPLKHTRKNIS